MNLSNHPIHQLPPARLAALENYLRPGRASEVGFLAATDSLVTVCDEDCATLQKIGITYQQIADKLRGIIAKTETIQSQGSLARGQKPLIGGKFEVSCLGSMGDQTCPFDENDDGMHSCGKGSRDYTVKNLSTGESINFPELGPHLIEAHQFFEGHTAYRMDPAALCRVLELKPNVNYKHSTRSHQSWSSTQSRSGTYEEEEIAAKTHAKAIQKINDVATAYLLPYDFYDDYKHRDLTKRERNIQKELGSNYTQEQLERECKRQDEIEALLRDVGLPYDPNQKCWVEQPGKDYCHIFVHRPFAIDKLPFTVFDREIAPPPNISIRDPQTKRYQDILALRDGMHVYENQTREEAVLDASDLQLAPSSQQPSSALS